MGRVVLVEKIKQYNEISNFVFSCEHFTMNSSSFSFKTESNVPTKKRKLNRDLSCLQITGQVGSGMYGTVFKATDSSSGNKVALKCIKMTKENDGFPVTAVREIKLLKAMNHENIIGLHEIVTYSRSKGARPYIPSFSSPNLINRCRKYFL
jgi:serine/threonine protein kinase